MKKKLIQGEIKLSDFITIRIPCSSCKIECDHFQYKCICKKCIVKAICNRACKEAVEYWRMYYDFVESKEWKQRQLRKYNDFKS